MPYSPEYRLKKKQQLVRIARGLFSRRGFDSVSINDIMAEAGLTHGGFYSYFTSKGDIYALAVEESAIGSATSGRSDYVTSVGAAQRVIRAYLAQTPVEATEESCLKVSLPTDLTRGNLTVKRVFEDVVPRLVGLFERSLEGGRGKRRDRALTMATLCIGAMAIARALTDARLSTELRLAALRLAFELAGWSRKRVPWMTARCRSYSTAQNRKGNSCARV